MSRASHVYAINIGWDKMEMDTPEIEEMPAEKEGKNMIFIIIGIIFLVVALLSYIIVIPIFSNFFLGEILGVIFLYKGYRP